VTTTHAATERAEEMAEATLLAREPRRRMLVIVNPYATTVSERLKNLVVHALRGRYHVEAVETEARAHATELCREAARERYDVVVAFGGDGTINEAANGLIGSDTAFSCLPGGATNVYCRTLGIPADIVDATEHLLGLADAFRPRRVDVGRVAGRYFTFASGVGLDAAVVERVDRHPRLKARLGEWYYAYAGVTTFSRRYLLRPPRFSVDLDGRSIEGVTLIVQNSDPFTFFGRRPVRVSRDAGLETGALAATVLRRATALELPTLLPRVLSGRPDAVANHRQVEALGTVRDLRVRSLDGRPMPVEVDGDHLGDFEEVAYDVLPRGLAVLG
jgi:diacylglycerol kinase family enzyme